MGAHLSAGPRVVLPRCRRTTTGTQAYLCHAANVVESCVTCTFAPSTLPSMSGKLPRSRLHSRRKPRRTRLLIAAGLGIPLIAVCLLNPTLGAALSAAAALVAIALSLVDGG
jgi:hypothetical protein